MVNSQRKRMRSALEAKVCDRFEDCKACPLHSHEPLLMGRSIISGDELFTACMLVQADAFPNDSHFILKAADIAEKEGLL